MPMRSDAQIVGDVRCYVDQLRDLRLQIACQPDTSYEFRRGYIEAVRTEELGLRALLDYDLWQAIGKQDQEPDA